MRSDLNVSLYPETMPGTLIPKVSLGGKSRRPRPLARFLHAAFALACEEASCGGPTPHPRRERRMRGPAAPSAPPRSPLGERTRLRASSSPREASPHPAAAASSQPPTLASCGGVRSGAGAAGSPEEPGPGLRPSRTPAPAGHLQRPRPGPSPLGRPRLPEPRGHTPSRSAPPPIPTSVPSSLLAQRLILSPTLPPILIGEEGGFADFWGGCTFTFSRS